jgi:hypothetical protein
MEIAPVRRSDRIFLELDIQITGYEISGREFYERTQTLVLSRHGAKILSQRTLVPQQELIVRCLKTGKEAVASVVGTIGETSEGFYYGIAFLDPEFDMWDIDFPPLPVAHPEGNKTFLECLSCHRLEVVPLDAFELEVLMASQRLLRFCERCGDSSVWRQISEAEARELPAPPPAPTPLPPPLPTSPQPRMQNDRQHPRAAIKMRAGMVTVAWGVEGVLIILLALAVNERSYRLTGLILLLVCVGKIILRDAWGLAPRDRYVTFIILGAALLLEKMLRVGPGAAGGGEASGRGAGSCGCGDDRVVAHQGGHCMLDVSDGG